MTRREPTAMSLRGRGFGPALLAHFREHGERAQVFVLLPRGGLFRATTGWSRPLLISTMQAAIAAARVWNVILPTAFGRASIFG